MTSNVIDTTCFKNAESPFTELFSLLQKHEIPSKNFRSLDRGPDELYAIHQHVDNAIVVLLQGLQDIGSLMSVASCNKKTVIAELKTIGFFIAGIGNLTEALNTLRSDAGYMLRQCNES